MSAFTWSLKEDTHYFEVQFRGELRGGNDIASDSFQKLVKQIKTEAEDRIVFLDLSKVTYWDTEGMRRILKDLVSEMNRNLGAQGTRAYVIAPKNGYLFNRAKEKYELDSSLIPWRESKEGLV